MSLVDTVPGHGAERTEEPAARRFDDSLSAVDPDDYSIKQDVMTRTEADDVVRRVRAFGRPVNRSKVDAFGLGTAGCIQANSADLAAVPVGVP